MRLALTALALLAVLCSPAAAFEWPDQVEVGQLLILEAPQGATCSWEVSGQDGDGDPYEPVWREFPGAVVVETRYVGLVTISLQTDATRGLRNVTWSVGVGEGADPGPDPVPPPLPVRLFVVVVYEEGDRDDYTTAQLDAIDSMEMREYMEGHGHFLRVVDQDIKGGDGAPPKTIVSFLSRAESHRPTGESKNSHLPRIIVSDQNAEILVDEMVVDEMRVLSVLKKFGGE